VIGHFCDMCGRDRDSGDHARCEARRRATDLPRYCVGCGRKLVVQVLPRSWRGSCVKCGPVIDR
jgi:hypothetical protein